MSKRDGGYKLPDELEPTDYICIPVLVPAQYEYVQAFYGALSELTRWYNWERDERAGGKRASEIFYDVMMQAYDDRGECFSMADLSDLLECCQAQTEILADLLECCQGLVAASSNSASKLIDIFTANHEQTEKILELIDEIGGDLSKTHADAPLETFTKGDKEDEDTGARKGALCMAVRTTIKIILARIAVEYDQQQPQIVDISSLFAGLLLGPNTGAVTGMIVSVVNLILDNWQGAVFTDEDAIEEVACYMYSNLYAKPSTDGVLAKSLDGFTGSTNAILIADAVREQLADFGNYLLFLRQLGINYELAKTNDWDPDPCLCGEPDQWVYSWDFEIEQELSPFVWGVTEGTLTEGGVIGEAEVALYFPEATEITRVQVNIGVTGANPAIQNLGLWVGVDNNNGEQGLISTPSPTIGINEWSGELECAEDSRLETGIWYTHLDRPDDWRIIRVTVWGVGNNPFGADHAYED